MPRVEAGVDHCAYTVVLREQRTAEPVPLPLCAGLRGTNYLDYEARKPAGTEKHNPSLTTHYAPYDLRRPPWRSFTWPQLRGARSQDNFTFPGMARNSTHIFTVIQLCSLDYMFVEWEGGEHSVVTTKVVDSASDFAVGSEVTCQLKEGGFKAKILAVG